MDWDDLFMAMAFLVAMKSKDKHTKVGAMVVDDDNAVRSVGYNGLPREIGYEDETMLERPHKYTYMEHAERNAIYNACRIGVSLKNCTMYTNGLPCPDCSRAIIQCGIKEVVVHKRWYDGYTSHYKDLFSTSLHLLHMGGVEVTFYDKPIGGIVGFRDGTEFDLK